ncbi:hypothetical protein EV702DRAFT_1196273 [Suillus placidus]|uniref:Uncharacterized protein n=1 Tax=Suillus placidus TaxID=48579 RepID=A0A9P6ZWX6_9AGAM|nr:hypothetical protein EV702DRAFT_1196273 [Suillus placidus]
MSQPVSQPSQPGLNDYAGTLDGSHHGQHILVHPRPHYAIPLKFYTAWPTSESSHLSHPLFAHAESSSMHQSESQAYLDPGSIHQPMIELPTLLDPALFENPTSPSLTNVNVEVASSHFDHVSRHAKIAHHRTKAKARPVLRNAKRVSMERAQFIRNVEAGTSSVTAQGSSGVSSQSGAKIIPRPGLRKLLDRLREAMKTALFNKSILPATGSLSTLVDSTWKDVADNQFSGTDRIWAQEMLTDKKYVDEKMGPVIDEVSQETMATARFFVYHYCRIDFDNVIMIVDKPAITKRAK